MLPAKISLSIEGTRGVLKGSLSPRIYDLVRNMPSRRRWRDRDLLWELTAQNIEYFHEHLKDAEWSPDLTLKLQAILDLRQTETEVSKARNEAVDMTRVKEFPFATQPYEHQLKAFLLSKDADFFGYFMEMGTGKSKCIIDKACYSYSTGKIDTLIILAPNGVHSQWIKEQIPIHIWKDIPYVSAIYRSGADYLTKQKLELVYNERTKFRIVSMNIEALSHDSGKRALEMWLSASRACLVIDESSRIKDQASTRTKTALKLGGLAVERIIATGTPVTQGVEDLYSQLSFLNENILGFSSFYTFRNRYCLMAEGYGAGGRKFHKVVGYKNLEELQKKLDGNTFRVLKEDCLTLPEKVYKNHYVELTEEQAKHYSMMKKHLIAQIDNGEIVEGALAITNLIRLQQILCGHLPSKEEGRSIPLKNNRIEACIDNINQANGKVIVWARFIADVDQISEALDAAQIGYVTYTGSTSQEARETALDRFKQHPHYKVFIGNPATAGIGLNLTAADTVIWYSMTYSLEEYLQANDRVHRIGQVNKVTYVHLICEGTVDEKVAKALAKKSNIATTLLDIREMLNE